MQFYWVKVVFRLKYKLDFKVSVIDTLFAFCTANYTSYPFIKTAFLLNDAVELGRVKFPILRVIRASRGLSFATFAAFRPISLRDKTRTNNLHGNHSRVVPDINFFLKIDSSTADISVLSEVYLGPCRFFAVAHR